MNKSFNIHIDRSPIRISRAGAQAAVRSGAGFHAHRTAPRGGNRNDMTSYLVEIEDARELENELSLDDREVFRELLEDEPFTIYDE